MDGYVDDINFHNEDPILVERYLYLQSLNKAQENIDAEIHLISEELKNIPPMPRSVDRWINSMSSSFKLSDFDKTFSLNRRYKKLMEERKFNGSRIKLFAIENVLEMIKEVEK